MQPQSADRSNLTAASSSLRAWLALFGILIACAPSLLIGIDARLSTHTMENVALVTSQETWLRLAAGDSTAWLISTNDGKPRLEKPPMLAWLNLSAWSDLDPASATPQQLTFRARCVSAGLGLLMLAAIFWMGCTLGDLRLGALAMLMVGSTFFFQRQARTASYDIHFVAWTALAVASGLWAMRPFGPVTSASRHITGWSICGLALCAAAMSKNPLPYLLALPPLIAAIVLTSPQRRTDAIALTAAALLSAAPVAWWYVHVFSEFREVAEKALGREVVQPRTDDLQPVYYYMGLFGLVAPWTLWLLGGLIEPFKIEHGPRRRAAMFAFFWFVFIFVALSIPAAKQQRYILAVMSAAGLLVAMFIRQHDERARSGRMDRLFETISAGTWIALAVASVGATVFLGWQDHALRVAARWVDHPQRVLAPLAWPWALALGAALLAICVVGWRRRADRPWPSATLMGAWMLLLMPVIWRQEALLGTPRVQVFVEEAARVRAIIGNTPLASLRWIETTPEGWDWKINEEFRLYYGRLIPRVNRAQFDNWLQTQPDNVFVMVRPHPDAAAFLSSHGFERVDHAMVDTKDDQELWRRASTPE